MNFINGNPERMEQKVNLDNVTHVWTADCGVTRHPGKREYAIDFRLIGGGIVTFRYDTKEERDEVYASIGK